MYIELQLNIDQDKEYTDETFAKVQRYLLDLYESPDVVKYMEITNLYEEELHKSNNYDENEIQCLKKNLRRKLESDFNGFNFINIQRKLFVYPDTLQMDDLVTRFVLLQKEHEKLKYANAEEKTVFNAAGIIRSEIRELKDEMPWPPQPEHLNVDNFSLPPYLDLFLHNLLSGRFAKDDSPRISRLKLSYGQDMMYAVSHGKLKTPKSILFPYIIKTLTNSTEVINIANRFGHGVSYCILEELETENAFNKIKRQTEEGGVVFPDGCQKDVFSIVVADNIDRLEETLSGILFFCCTVCSL